MQPPHPPELSGPSAAPAGAEHRFEAPPTAPVRALSRWSLAWRVLVAGLALVICTLAQIQHTDSFFPFTAMAMFAQARDPEGQVDSTCLEGTVAGTSSPRDIPFSEVGVQRADVEGHLGQITADPSRLQPLAEAYARRHPEAPLSSISVCVDRTHLHEGAPAGTAEHLVPVTWQVR